MVRMARTADPTASNRPDLAQLESIREQLRASRADVELVQGRLAGAYALRDERIVEAIEQWGLSQRDVAFLAGISQQRVLAILART